ncbi:hypothetical protein GCM10027517_15020 [Phycicoccus ginsengisoli]
MDLGAALAAVASAPSLLEGMRAGDAVADAAARATAAATPGVVDVLRSAVVTADPLTTIAAVHAIGACADEQAGEALADLLDDARPFVVEHALDALRLTPVVDRALEPLVRACCEGGFRGMLAQRTLEHWAVRAPDVVTAALAGALAHVVEADPRARVVETLGLVPGPGSSRILLDLAAGEVEQPVPVRRAALAALGQGPAADLRAEELLVSYSRSVGPLAETARLALHDLGPDPAVLVPSRPAVVQLFLHADIDGQLHQAGRGDTGGIATLLVQLGDALVRQRPRGARVITVSGGRPDLAHFPIARGNVLAGDWEPGHRDPAHREPGLRDPGHHYTRLPLAGFPQGIPRAWPARVAARRGMRRVLRAAGRVDAIHVRMADVGSMAAAEVARELGIPVVLTAAPDPQALIASRDAAGTLTRDGFGDADVVEHLWFRDRLLRDLAATADHLVVLPRREVDGDLRRFLGLDLASRRDRVAVVAEGIDLSAVDRAVREGAEPALRTRGTATALAQLEELLATLPPDRRALPIAVSVGRLSPVKGMATLARAWADDDRLRARCNLLVVGGDLDDPSDDEAAELARIASVLPRERAAVQGLLLAGHRPNATTAAWLAAVRRGDPASGRPPGVYVSASLKEEFGIAILEAMGVGLVVVAPDGGGPATYVADGRTGFLVDTSSRAALVGGVHAALDLAATDGADERAAGSRHMVRSRFGIDAMATSLADVYESVARRSRPGTVGPAAVEDVS